MSNLYASFDEYGLRHIPHHLLRGEKWQELERMLIDFGFIETKVTRLKDSISLIQDYDSAIEQITLIYPSTSARELGLQRLQEMRKHVWAEASAIQRYPSCVTQQLANRLQWSSTGDNYMKKQADRAVQRCLDEDRPVLRALLPNPDPTYGTQRIIGSETADTTGMAMVNCGLVLWSNAGDWQVVDIYGSILFRDRVPPMPLQQLVGGETTLIAISGRVIRYWEMFPKGETKVKMLPFVALQVALAFQDREMVAIGQNGEWARYSLYLGDLKERRVGRLQIKGTCCAMASSGEYWVIGTTKGQILLCTDAEEKIIFKHQGMVRAVAIHPEGGIIVSGGQDCRLQLTTIDGKTVHSVTCDGWINDVTFSADGTEVLCVTESGQLLSLLITQLTKVPLVWISQDIPFKLGCFLPTVSTIAVLATDNRVRLVERPQGTISTWRSPLSSDVKHITGWRGSHSILVIDAEDNRFIVDLDSSPPHAERISEPAGPVLDSALLGGGQLITIYQDLGQSRVTRQIDGLQTRREELILPRGLWQRLQSLLFGSQAMPINFAAAAFSPDLQTFILASNNAQKIGHKIEAYNAISFKRLFEIDWPFSNAVSELAISNQASHILAGGSLSHPPQLFSRDALSKMIDLPVKGCRGAVFSASGNELLIIDGHRAAWFSQNPLQDQGLDKLDHHNITCCDLSPDARWVLLVNSDGVAVLIDRIIASRNLLTEFPARVVLPWKANYCHVYPQRQWVVFGGHSNFQVLQFS